MALDIFEGKVALGLAEFSERLHDENNDIWLAIHNDQIIGSVAIDGQDLGNNEAHLRWFILEDGYQGSGIGKRLLAEAITFAIKNSLLCNYGHLVVLTQLVNFMSRSVLN